MTVTLGDLARLVDGELHGDSDLPITGADTIRDAHPGDITFAESAKLATKAKLDKSQASAVLTPPDVISQFALAVPIILLYEISIIIGRSIEKKRDQEAAAAEKDDEGDPAAKSA